MQVLAIFGFCKSLNAICQEPYKTKKVAEILPLFLKSRILLRNLRPNHSCVWSDCHQAVYKRSAQVVEWYTRTLEVRMPRGVGVRVPF